MMKMKMMTMTILGGAEGTRQRQRPGPERRSLCSPRRRHRLLLLLLLLLLLASPLWSSWAMPSCASASPKRPARPLSARSLAAEAEEEEEEEEEAEAGSKTWPLRRPSSLSGSPATPAETPPAPPRPTTPLWPWPRGTRWRQSCWTLRSGTRRRKHRSGWIGSEEFFFFQNKNAKTHSTFSISLSLDGKRVAFTRVASLCPRSRE